MEQTDSRQRGVGWLERTGRDKPKNIYASCQAHGHRPQCGKGWGGAETEWRRAKVRGKHGSCHSVNNKITNGRDTKCKNVEVT